MKHSPLLLLLALGVTIASSRSRLPAAAQQPATTQQPVPAVPQAQQAPVPAPPAIISPEVLIDRRVTFRLRAPNAQKVELDLEGSEPLAMQKDDQGVWSATTSPLDPDFYGYFFVADGVRTLDPSNTSIKPNLLFLSNQVHVPGPTSLPWEVNDVPHGAVHHHFYHSAVVGDDRDFYVYTPPRYDPAAQKRYPVLYLLHGFSDAADAWTAVGRANVILDNLIAQGSAVPMIVVMPLGYGVPQIVFAGGPPMHDPVLRQQNISKFSESLVTEVIPMVEKEYRAKNNREARAVAGLSMGGAESLDAGLNNLNRFAWVGSFSAGGFSGALATEFPAVDSKANAQLRSLWIACGTEDHLIEANRKLRAFLTSRGVRHTDIETPGMHTWMVWRRNLASFVPLLFRQAMP